LQKKNKINNFFKYSFLRRDKLMRRILFVFFSNFLFAQTYFAQQKTNQLTRILFVFDASNSMNAGWQSSDKISIARKLMAESLSEIKGKENLELALRVYGHTTQIANGQDCEDTKLEIPFAKNNEQAIIEKLKSISCRGTTPIAYSLEKAAGDFPATKDSRNIIILITDGIEACDGDPCAVSRALQAKSIILKPFVIGIGLDENFTETFSCIGNFYDVSNEDNFKNVLDVVIAQALNNTTTQINLLDANGKPTETDVPITFYNSFNKQPLQNIIHTINSKGNPDTIILDPVINYDMLVHTLPLVEKKAIKLIPGVHNIITANTPQGTLNLVSSGKGNDKILAVIRQKGKSEIINAQTFNTKVKYLVGTYELEILTLPRLKMKEVEIKQSYTTNIIIPESGVLNFSAGSSGSGAILVKEGSKLSSVTNLNTELTNEQFVLLPGNYVLVYRSKNSKETVYTIEKEFKIISGTTINIRL
jgi:Ca-activated chloride channel homolog